MKKFMVITKIPPRPAGYVAGMMSPSKTTIDEIEAEDLQTLIDGLNVAERSEVYIVETTYVTTIKSKLVTEVVHGETS